MVNIKFSKKLLMEYAKLYEQKWPHYIKQEKEFFEWFTQHRYLNKKTFIELGCWKTKRQTKNYLKNSDDFIKKTTTQALLANNDNNRLEILMRLHGVSWAVGSVILHFAFPNQYPILDFRVIWSLGFQQPKSYNFEF